MILYFFQVFAAVFASTDPIGAAPVFVGLTSQMTHKQKWHAAVRASIATFLILAVSVLAGRFILKAFGISLPAFQTAGGLVIVIMGLEMLRGTPTRVQHDDPDNSEKEDPIIIPFSMPLIAGPGAITTMITLTTRHDGWTDQIVSMVAIAAEAVVLLVILLSATWFSARITPNGMKVLLRFLGLILLAMGAQLMLTGIQLFLGIGNN
jgi:multiple antibiotic resistance protein